MQEWWRKMSEWLGLTVHTSRTVPWDQRPLLGRKLGHWVYAVLVGIGFALIGPYGTYLTMPISFRLWYWEAIILFGFSLWWCLQTLFKRLFPGQPYALQEAAVIMPFAMLNSVYLVSFHHWLNTTKGTRIPTVWTDYFISHLILSSVVIVPAIILARRFVLQVEARAGGEAIDFLTEKLPPKLRGQTPYALAAEGHYVRIYTSRGDDLITMKFEDALRAVVGLNGLQTHRSWWIALDEIVETKAAGSAYEATLRSGLKVPVSRRRKADLTRAQRETP